MLKKIFVILLVLVIGHILLTDAEGVTVGVTVYETGHNLTQISQAAVYADNGLVGKTDETGYLEFSHPVTADMEITVIKRGYEDWTGMLGGNTTSLLVEMKKKNLTLGVTVYDADALYPVSGAEVTLAADGFNMSENTDSNGSVSFPVRAEGLYDLSIHAPNYQTRDATVEMGIENKSVDYWLYQNTHFAIVVKDDTTTQPVEDAEVFIDGVKKGTTDQRGALSIDILRDKVYQITIKKDGYQDYIEKRIISNDEAFVTLPIKKAPATVFIFVHDETKSPVENAEIFLGNTQVGTTNTLGRATLGNLTMGTYPLSVRHPEYLNQSFSLEVTDMAGEFNIQLEYKTANLTIATLGTDKKPIPGTLISINGKQTGITDKDGEYTAKLRLNIPYTINATKEGYNSATVRTEVASLAPPIQTIIMQKSMNLLLVGSLFLIGAGLILILMMRRRTKGSHHPRHGKGGL